MRIVRARPENVTSTVVSVASAAASAQVAEALAHDLVLGLVVAADHEPGGGTVRDDVGRCPAVADDAVDAGGRPELLAPQADRGEQHDQRVERVLAQPRVGCGMGLQPGEDHLDVLRGERVALHVRAIARVVEQRRVDPLEQPVVDHELLAAAPFLGGRAEEDDLARQVVGDGGQGDRRTDPGGGHRVVAAAVAEPRQRVVLGQDPDPRTVARLAPAPGGP